MLTYSILSVYSFLSAESVGFGVAVGFFVTFGLAVGVTVGDTVGSPEIVGVTVPLGVIDSVTSGATEESVIDSSAGVGVVVVSWLVSELSSTVDES